jgi:hypothetical protein
MKKLLGLLFVLMLFITGCTDDGILRITSNSSEDVWYQLNYGTTTWLSSGTSDSHSWNLSSSMFGEEDKNVTVTYGGGEWFWYDTYEVDKTIKPGKTSNVQIIGDRGAIKIVNETFETSIHQIYISQSSDPEWGNNLLTDPFQPFLNPGYYALWYASEGYWDIKLVDENGYIYTIMNEMVSPEITNIYTFEDDTNRSLDSIKEKMINSQKYSERSEGKVKRKLD